ncbi:hypothetical protein PHMEG_0009929 [Phytophthora megakarya]|uniref:Uncharacterized protein n=1 Tax=Phytophthora megakarya TaxID=4795 RepID=A0A225WH06_9STRA|nr:hypothetical protein PHMEG_0009929 [Phytophthora megakarya]
MNIGAPKTLVSNFDTHKTASIARAIVEFSSDDDENQLVRNRGRSYHQRRKPALQTEIIDDHEGDTCTHPRCFAVARLHQKCIRHGGSSKCSQPGCNKNAFAKGKCVKHRSWTRQESITRYLTKIPVKDTRMDEQDAKPTLGIQTGSAFVTTSSAVKGKEKTEKKTTASSMHTGAQIRNDFTAVPTRTTTVLTSYNSRPHYTTEGNVSYSRPVCIAYANPNSYSTDINSQCEGGICLNPTCTSLAQANGFCINHNLRAELPFALAQEWRA